MGELDWNTPPTEEEMKQLDDGSSNETTTQLDWNTPPTEDEIIYLKDEEEKVKEESFWSSPLAKKKEMLEELKIDKEIKELLFQAGKDTGSALKGAAGSIGAFASSIPANVAETVGVDASGIRESQKWWQDLKQEAKDELTKTYGDSDTAKELLFAAANPTSYLAGGLRSMMGIAGTEKAMDVASEGDRSGVSLDDAKGVAISAGIGGAVGKAADYLFPPSATEKNTRFGNLVERLPDDQKATAKSALDTLDSIGVTKLNPEARERIINKIGIDVDDKTVNQKVIKSLGEELKRSKDEYTKAYEDAYVIAKDAGTSDIGDVIKDIVTNKYGDRDAPLKGDKEAENAYKKIVSLIGKNKVVDANQMEKMLTVLKDQGRAAEGSTSLYYQRAVDAISKKQEELLKNAGIDGVYNGARELWTKHKLDFEGEVFGGQLPTGATAGKAIDTALKSQDNFGLTKKLLGTNIDPNVAEGLLTKISPLERRDMVFNYMIDGVNGTKDLGSPENVSKFVSNWRAARTDKGLEMMLGKEEFNRVNKLVNALDFTNQAIKGASKEDLSIAKDALEMTAAIAAAKISPYAAVHVSINKAKSILDKKLLKQEGGLIIERIKKIKDKQLQNKLMKTMSQIMIAGSNTADYKDEE